MLIAYRMNGDDLPLDHGYPVRAVVPGHYGMASVKWLTHIQAVRKPFRGYWQTSDYGYWDYLDGKPVRRPLAEMKLKSEIARPRVYEMLAPNQPYTVFGAAWAGESRGNGNRGEHRRWPDVGRGRIHRPRRAVRVATLEIRLAHPQHAW